jgi:hypothetical protein
VSSPRAFTSPGIGARLVALVFLLTAAILFPTGVEVAGADPLELPDLISVPPTRLQAPETVTWRGETSLVIRFDGHVTNVGEGPLDLFGNPSTGSVMQRARSGDDWVDVTSPQVIYETADGHNHWHLMKVARYSLWNESRTAEVAPGQKVGFCLYDVVSVSGAPVVDPSFYEGPVVRWCEVGNPQATQLRMGISAGYQDVYDKSLTYQWVDVSDVQPGVYWVAAQIDPENVVVESNEANNTLSFSARSVIVPGHIAEPLQVNVDSDPVDIALAATTYGSPEDQVFQIIDPPQHGSLDVAAGATIWSGSVRYTPDPGYAGSDTFTYVAADPISAYPRNPAAATVNLDVGRNLSPTVTISGAPASLVAGTSIRLTASLVNAGSAVDWYVDGIPGGSTLVGTIDGSGLYRAPSVPPPAGSVTVRAQSRDVPSAFDEVTIAIEPAPAAPVVTAPPTQTNTVGDTVSLPVPASDANGDRLTFWASGLPPGLTIDAVSGTISGVVSTPGSFNVRVYAGDGSLTGSAAFTWIVEAAAPHVGAISDVTVDEGAAVVVDLHITDPQGLPYTCTLTGPSYVAKDGEDRLSITPGYDDAGVADVTVIVTNEAGASASATFTVAVRNVNRPPLLAYIPDQWTAEGTVTRVPVTFSDPDRDQVGVEVRGPGFASYDPAARAVVLSPGFSDAGTAVVVVTVTDRWGAATERSFTAVVDDTNRPPHIDEIADVSVAAGGVASVPIAAVDPDGDPVTVSLSAPSFVSLDATAEALVIRPSSGDAGSYEIGITVTDAGGLSRSVSLSLVVTDGNRPPSLTQVDDMETATATEVAMELDAEDLDGHTLTFGATGLPAGLTIDPDTGEIAGTVGFDAAGVHDVEVTVSDGAAVATMHFTWTVTDVAPEASISVRVTGRGARAVIDLSARSSVDPEGGSLRYFWDLDGDDRYDDARRWWTRFESGPGSFVIGLRVVDPAGNRDDVRVTVEIP